MPAPAVHYFGGGDATLAAILAVLKAQSLAVWFDAAWTPGVTLQDDAGTQRMTAMQSRPIAGQTQYTVSQGSLSLAPATTLTLSGKRGLTFAGSHYLRGSSALAALFAGAATYSEVSYASRSQSSTATRWNFGHSTLDNRISHYMAAIGTSDSALRTAAGSSTFCTPGSTMALNTSYVLSSTFNGSAYNSWLNGASSLVAFANTRAPAALDDMVIGGQLAAGVVASFWGGLQAGIAITSALSTPDRQSLETLFRAYYG